MPPELLSLLIQLPVVAVFIWYSERINRQFQRFLEEQRANDREVLQQMLAEIKKLGESHEEHDKHMAAAITKMEERTSRTKPR